MKKEFNFSIKAVIIIIIVTAITSSITSGLILYNNSKILIGTSDLKKDTALQEFLKVYYKYLQFRKYTAYCIKFNI